METVLSKIEDLEDSVEGAVIEALEHGVDGLHIVLADGRYLIFPDAVVVALISPQKTLQ